MSKFVVSIYEDSKGNSQIYDWVQKLNRSNRKIDQSVLKKFYFQVARLEQEGYGLTAPVAKKLKGYDLYELRPMPYRVFYGAVKGNEFVLLHSFEKKSNKTPKSEIDKAQRELFDWIERNGE